MNREGKEKEKRGKREGKEKEKRRKREGKEKEKRRKREGKEKEKRRKREGREGREGKEISELTGKRIVGNIINREREMESCRGLFLHFLFGSLRLPCLSLSQSFLSPSFLSPSFLSPSFLSPSFLSPLSFLSPFLSRPLRPRVWLSWRTSGCFSDG
jgi:hypothetical protein